MQIYKTISVVEMDDELLEELVEDVTDGDEYDMIIVDGWGNTLELYCVSADTIKQFHVDSWCDEPELKTEEKIIERQDDRIITPSIKIEKASKYSNIWRINDSLFGDVESDMNFSEYKGDLKKWFMDNFNHFIEVFDAIEAPATFSFGTHAIDYDGITEVVGEIEVVVDVLGRKIWFTIYSDGELIEGNVKIPLPDGSMMPVGILKDKEFWVGLKKLYSS